MIIFSKLTKFHSLVEDTSLDNAMTLKCSDILHQEEGGIII